MFVIAEAGVNHNGSAELAHRLIDITAELGADAVKFQTFDADAVVAAGTGTVAYQKRTTGKTDQQEMLRALELAPTVWSELAAHCADLDLEFMSTAFDLNSLALLLDIGVRRLKVPSGELTNLPFIRVVADAGLPMIISTGMGTMPETLAAVDAAAAAPERSVLHCVSAYPAPLHEANLLAIPKLRESTGCNVGWSDHCIGTTAVIMAVALGATLVERHLTLDTSMDGPDHAASDDPDEFARYIEAIRTATRALGDGEKQPTPSEAETRRLARRSWHAARPLKSGESIASHDIVALRPATGLSPAVDLVGAILARDVNRGESITLDALTQEPQAP